MRRIHSHKRRPPLTQRLRAFLGPAVLFVVIMGITLILREISLQQFYRDLQEASQAESRKVADLLKSFLDKRMTALKQVANLYNWTDDVSEAQFKGFSRQVMQDAPGIMAIVATDPNLEPVWVSAEEPLEHAEARSLLSNRAMASAVERIRRQQSRDFVITDPAKFPDYGNGFGALIPFFDDNGNVEGFIVGIFLYTPLVNSLVTSDLLGNFNIRLHQWDTQLDMPLYMRSDQYELAAPPRGDFTGVEQSFFMGSQMWKVYVEPTGYIGASPYFFTSGTILVLGSLLAILVSALLYRQQLVAARSQFEASHSRSRLATTSDRLAEIKEQLDLILNNVDEGIILYAEDFRPLQANAAFRQTFEKEAEPSLLELPAQEHHRRMAARFQNEHQYFALLNNLRENPELPFADDIGLKKEGGHNGARFYQRRATVVIGPDESRMGYLIIYQDVTPARTMEKLKEDFHSSVTHDLRTPLAAIRGFAETMLRDPQMPEATRQEFTGIIFNETERLQEMIEDLLDLRRMEEGRLDLQPASFDLRDLVHEVVNSSRPIFDAHDIEVQIQWEENGPNSLLGDRSKIGRALRNILTNAVKYSPSDTAIRIRSAAYEDRVELEFIDEGPGIPEEELPHIFEKFYRGSQHVRRTQGTGLGLAIVRHIIESHGGVVSAHNAPEGGAVIRLVLPRESEIGLGSLAMESSGGDEEGVGGNRPASQSGAGS